MKTDSIKKIGGRFFLMLSTSIFIVFLGSILSLLSPAHAVGTTFNVTASAGTGGSISPSGTFTVPSAWTANFTITPDPGYHVASIYANGVNYGAQTVFYYYPVISDLNVAVSFAPNTSHAIVAITGSGGSISPSGTTSVGYGSNVTYTMTPDPGYHVDRVTVDDVYVGQNSTHTFTNVTGPHTIRATFAADSFPIVASAWPNGTISPSGTTMVPNGSYQVYAFVPDPGYRIAEVLLDGAPADFGGLSYYLLSNVSASHTISVRFSLISPFDTIDIAPFNPTIGSGETLQLFTTVYDQSGGIITPTPEIVWTSDNTAVATVDGSGTITGISAGTGTITGVSRTLSGSVIVTVTNSTFVPVATTIDLTPSSAMIDSGAIGQFFMTVFDQNGDMLEPAPNAVWTSDNTAVATVDGFGTVFGISPGTATISATIGNAVGTALVTVITFSPVITTIDITPFDPTIGIGATEQLSVTVFDQNGGVIMPIPDIVWTSDNPAVATVDGSGMITGMNSGTAMVDAIAGNVIGTVLVTVGVPTAATAIVPLDVGWNLISLPLQETDSLGQAVNRTAESLGQLIGADIVTRWSNASQSYGSHIVGLPINDFALSGSEGFFVHVPAPYTLTMTGSSFLQTTPAISAGWNLVGFNNPTSTVADAFWLSFTGADVVSKFNSATQTWTSHIMNFPLNDFNINRGNGVFIHKP